MFFTINNKMIENRQLNIKVVLVIMKYKTNNKNKCLKNDNT